MQCEVIELFQNIRAENFTKVRIRSQNSKSKAKSVLETPSDTFSNDASLSISFQN